jgi:hypothetical protein
MDFSANGGFAVYVSNDASTGLDECDNCRFGGQVAGGNDTLLAIGWRGVGWNSNTAPNVKLVNPVFDGSQLAPNPVFEGMIEQVGGSLEIDNGICQNIPRDCLSMNAGVLLWDGGKITAPGQNGAAGMHVEAIHFRTAPEVAKPITATIENILFDATQDNQGVAPKTYTGATHNEALAAPLAVTYENDEFKGYAAFSFWDMQGGGDTATGFFPNLKFLGVVWDGASLGAGYLTCTLCNVTASGNTNPATGATIDAAIIAGAH